MIYSSGWQIFLRKFVFTFVCKCQPPSKKPLNYSTHKTKTDLLSKTKVVFESTSFKKFYNHNILSITSSYIKKKSKCVTSVNVFSILPLTPQRAIKTLCRRHMFISNIAWFIKFFRKEQFKRLLYEYSNNTRGKNDIFHLLVLYVMNESAAQMVKLWNHTT